MKKWDISGTTRPIRLKFWDQVVETNPTYQRVSEVFSLFSDNIPRIRETFVMKLDWTNQDSCLVGRFEAEDTKPHKKRKNFTLLKSLIPFLLLFKGTLFCFMRTINRFTDPQNVVTKQRLGLR